MREVILTCDECEDDDPTTRPCVIDHGRVLERVDLCSFCRTEIDSVTLATEELLAA